MCDFFNFFNSDEKPHYELTVTYDPEITNKPYHYNMKYSNISGKDGFTIKEEYNSGDSKKNPLGAFWEYNPQDLPSFVFNS